MKNNRRPNTKWLIIFALMGLIVVFNKFIVVNGYTIIINNFDNYTFKQLIYLLTGLLLLVIIGNIINYLSFVERKKQACKNVYELQKQQLAKLNTTYTKLISEGQGALLTRLNNDCNIAGNNYSRNEYFIFFGSLQFITAIIYGCIYSWLYTLIIIILTAISCFLPMVIIKKIQASQHQKLASEDDYREKLTRMLQASETIRNWKLVNWAVEKLNKTFDIYCQHHLKNTADEQLLLSISMGIGFLINALWFGIGIYLISINKITIGVFVGFISLSMEFSWPFNELSSAIVELKEAQVSFKRLNEKSNNTMIVTHHLKDSILALENLNFAYQDNLIYNNFNLILEKNKTYQLVGDNGSGKTTLLEIFTSLLQGTGKINYAPDLTIGYLSQKPFIYNATILENLMGNQEVSLEEVKKYLNMLNLQDLIIRLPNGLNTCYSEQLGLSTGELKRLCIVRLLLYPANLYLIDEPLAGIDKENQYIVLNALNKLPGTKVIVSHQPLTALTIDEKIKIN